MPRLSPLPLDALDGGDRALIEQSLGLMGFTANDALTMARVPGLLKASAALVGATLATGAIDPALKRLIGLAASMTAGCDYCQAHTTFGALRRGVDKSTLTALSDYESSAAFSDRERAAIRVAAKSAEVPNAVSDGDFAALHEHFSDDEIAEITAVIALYGFLNRWNSTLLTEIEAEPAACILADT